MWHEIEWNSNQFWEANKSQITVFSARWSAGEIFARFKNFLPEQESKQQSLDCASNALPTELPGVLIYACK